MTSTEILSNLCCYDDRNPDRVDGDLPQDERPQRKPNCHCDNCFYGRTRMAEYILSLQIKRETELQNAFDNARIKAGGGGRYNAPYWYENFKEWFATLKTLKT